MVFAASSSRWESWRTRLLRLERFSEYHAATQRRGLVWPHLDSWVLRTPNRQNLSRGLSVYWNHRRPLHHWSGQRRQTFSLFDRLHIYRESWPYLAAVW